MRKNRKALMMLALTSAITLGGASLYISPVSASGEFKEQEFGLMPERTDDIVIPLYHELTLENGSLNTNATTDDEQLESYYSAVEDNKVTPIKNQGGFGTCWAHAAVSTMESSLIANHEMINGQYATKDNVNLSERHLAYFTYHTVVDKLGGMQGDSTTLPDTRNYLDMGGNVKCTLFSLATWMGMSDENVASYAEIGDANHDGKYDSEDHTMVINNLQDYKLDDSKAYVDQAVLKEGYFVRLANRNEVKKLIKKYGSATIAYNMNRDYCNWDTKAYNNKADNTTNHEVCIVGWDDNYDKNNFLEECRPSSNGAWLVKNSWGTGDKLGDGYLWISYENRTFKSNTSAACFFIGQAANTYDNIFQYDGTASPNTEIVKSGSSLANRFVVPQGIGAQSLEAVSLAVNDTNVNYSIQIYKNCDGTDPESGVKQFEEPQTGNLKYSGYYTIPLDKAVNLEEGDSFSVVVTYTLPERPRSYVSVFMDRNTEWGYTKMVNHTSPNQSFVKTVSDTTWGDYYYKQYSEDVTPRIKAFTKNRF